jgi:lipopolysaccharide export system permease protein
MRILDRYILMSFLVNYLLALCVLVGMYVLLDVIVNAQDFARGATPTPPAAKAPATHAATAVAKTAPASRPAPSSGSSGAEIASDMFDYYFYQLPVIFQQVSGIIPLLAAGFTMVRMTRHHELTAMLASGVSLYRVAMPIILVSIFFAALNVANQELLISQPTMIQKLLRKHDEMNQPSTRNEALIFIKTYSNEEFNEMIVADDYDPVKHVMTNVRIYARDPQGMPLRHTNAASAHWEFAPEAGREAWVMTKVFTEDDGRPNPDARQTERQIITSSLTPEQLDLILSKKAIDYLSYSQVAKLSQFPAEANKALLEKIMHLRVTQPLMNLILLLIGIPFLLTREPNRLVINMLFCTAVSGFIFIATFVMFQLGGTHIAPLWAAWLPVLVFGPFALVMMDTIHT